MLYTALLVLLFWFGSSSAAVFVPMDTSLFGANWDIVSPILSNNVTAKRVISAILMFTISIQAARLAIRNVIYLERTYMPSVIFVILSAAFYSVEYSLAPLITTLFLVLSFSQGLRIYTIKTIASRRILTSGIYLGLSALIYPPAAYLTPFILVILSIFRIGNFKELIVGITGVALPLAIYFFILWVLQRDVEFAWDQYYRAMTLNDGTIGNFIYKPLNLVQYTLIGVVTLLFILSIIRFLRNFKAYKRRSALGFVFFIIVALWSTIVMFISPARSLYMLPISALAFSIVIPTYFAANRPTFWTNFLYALLLFSSIAIHLI